MKNIALTQRKQVACPEGSQTGIITAGRETTKDFGKKDPTTGRPMVEPVVEFVIQPDYKVEGAETIPVSVLYSPTLNGLSGLSGFLQRIGKEPAEGATFHPASINGTRVRFDVKKQDNGFVRVLKDSIVAA